MNQSRSVDGLLKGFPSFVYAMPSPDEENQKQYHVGSPGAIEHLGLPYRVVVEMKKIITSEYIPVNTYHNGVVDKRPMDESYKDKEGKLYMRVKLQ